jgi:hypothetical protein
VLTLCAHLFQSTDSKFVFLRQAKPKAGAQENKKAGASRKQVQAKEEREAEVASEEGEQGAEERGKKRTRSTTGPRKASKVSR